MLHKMFSDVANASEEELDLLIDAQGGTPAEYVAAGRDAVSSAVKSQEWCNRYIERLVIKGKMTHREANDVLKGGMGEYDYDDSPEDSADMELSYWSSDGEEAKTKEPGERVGR